MVFRLAILLLTVWCAVFDRASAQQVNYFRQDHGRAMADDEPLPAELDDANQRWKAPLPPGHSTPLLLADRILLTAHEGNELSTICLDRATGDVLWKQTVRAEQLEKNHAEGSPASSTPASDGQRVYAFFGSYGLLCYTIGGDPVWTRRMGPFRDEFGSASSPILVDDKVVLCEDHDLDSFLIAVRADNGETVWQSPREGFTRSYATPVLWEVDGKKQIVMAGALQLVAYDPRDGSPLWSRDGFARIVNPTPALADGTLYVCTWSPGGDTDARIAMEPWSQALAQWDANKNARLEKTELPVGEVQSRFYRI
ncbi:MAG: PQQ-binding-like beta-propeller repeat protein, partial [Pirellulales bacterium]